MMLIEFSQKLRTKTAGRGRGKGNKTTGLED
jgi:hypothetical protein